MRFFNALVVLSFVFCLSSGANDDRAQSAEFQVTKDEKALGGNVYSWKANDLSLPALSEDILAKLVKPPRLVESDAFGHRVLVVPQRGFRDPKIARGGILLLHPGTTATEFTPIRLPDSAGNRNDVFQEPAKISLHKTGFFYALVVGPSYIVGTYSFSATGEVFQEKVASLEVALINDGSASVDFGIDRVSIKTKVNTMHFGMNGAKVDANTQFHELTSQNKTVLQNEFHATSLMTQVEQGKIDNLPYTKAHVDRALKILAQNKSASPLLVETKFGVDATAIVNSLAHRLAAGETLRGDNDWQIYEVNWTELGSQGLVNLTVDKVNRLFNVCKNKRVILYFPNIHQLRGLGVDQKSTNNDATASMLKDITDGTVLIIGHTTNSGNNELVSTAKAFTAGFTTMRIEPPSQEVLEPVLAEYMKTLEIAHGVLFDVPASTIIEVTNQFIPEEVEAQPAKSMAALRALSTQTESYMPDGLKLGPNGEKRISEAMLRNYVGEKVGIATLGSSEQALGLKSFIEKENYWPAMDKLIVGHKEAKQAVRNALMLISADNSARLDGAGGELGGSAILLLGSSGTGKSYVPIALSKALKKYKVDMPVFPIELGKFKSEANVTTLTGATPGYLGFREEGSKFLNQLRQHPQTILVLEEIDKADPSIMQAIYELLENGRFQDANLNEVKFTRGLIVLTSNFGGQGTASKIVVTGDGEKVVVDQEGTSDLIDQYDRWHLFKTEPTIPQIKTWTEEQLKSELVSRLQASGRISPQVLNRIGLSNVILMHHFTRAEIDKLAEDWFKIIADRFSVDTKKTASLQFSEEAKQWVKDTAWGPDGSRAFDGGARSVIDVMEKRIYVAALEAFNDLSADEKTPGIQFTIKIENDKPVAAMGELSSGGN